METMKELGWTPLHCATENQNISLIKELLQQGENVNISDNFDRTPLSIAAAKGNLQLLELFHTQNANFNSGFPLHFACEKGHVDVVKCLIKNGASVNLDRENNYPLLIAASLGNLEISKILVENGADVLVVDHNKETALHWACDSGNIDLVSFLIDSGCNVDMQDRFGLTPLSICLIRKEDRPDLVRLLLKKGASIHLSDDEGYTYLHQTQHPESLRELISYGLDVNSQNVYKETPLFTLSFDKDTACVEVLLQANADPNIWANGGWTPLHVAAGEGHLDSVEELLKREANVNAATAKNVIPLHLASEHGHFEIAKRLLEGGSFIDVATNGVRDFSCIFSSYKKFDGTRNGDTPLSLAVRNGHWDVCRLLVEHGATTDGFAVVPQEINSLAPVTKTITNCPQQQLLNLIRTNDLDAIENIPNNDERLLETDSIGWTLLHQSTASELPQMCSTLLQKGVPVNVVDKFNRTPLSLAAAKDDSRTLKVLLENGADVNLGIALHFAADTESFECVEELLRYDCDVNIKEETKYQSSVLHRATSDSKKEMVKILLEHGADPNCINKWGETPLHMCCRKGDLALTKMLIDHGAEVNAIDTFKDTPLICASISGSYEVVKLLIDNNADVQATDKFNRSSLHHACCSNYPEIVAELVTAGTSVNVITDEGETPLCLVEESPTILKTLIEANSDVNYQMPGGWTALHKISESGNLHCVQELLRNGANVNSASAEFVLPIYLAAIAGHSSVVEELLDNGSYVDPYILDIGVIRDDSGNLPLRECFHIVEGNTPLIGAASKGHFEVMKILHSRGASLKANKNGNTALHEAVLCDSEACVEFLLTLDIDVSAKNLKGKTAFDLTEDKGCAKLVQLNSNKM